LRLVGPLLLLVTALWVADALLSRDRTVGWERNTVRNALNRVHTAKDARVAILGSSTSADWLPNAFAAQTLGRKAGEIVDAHLNGCHQPCTWSEVQGLLAQGRHYDVAFFGTNLFQQCEFVSPKRQLQDEMLLPTASIPAAFALYARAEDPLGYVARFLGVKLSGVYGDTGFLQDEWRKATLGAPSPTDAWRWARAVPPPEGGTHDCSYDDDAIAYKTAVTGALLDDLRRPTRVTVIVRAGDIDSVPLRRELERLATDAGWRLVMLPGSRNQHPMTARYLTELAPELPTSDVYVCGPDEFTEAVLRAAQRAGVPEHRLHHESFAF